VDRLNKIRTKIERNDDLSNLKKVKLLIKKMYCADSLSENQFAKKFLRA